MRTKVVYRAKNDAHEQVHIGHERSDGRCARLDRFGRPITIFLISRRQERALRRGGTINVTSRAIERAHNLSCAAGGLAGTKRRRR